jgi:type I restriction enzyme M protein
MVFKAKEKHPEGYKTYFGYWKDDGFTKRKTGGRADYNGVWSKIKKEWLNNYRNREELVGHSVKRCVLASDEWCVEAYMETDYSKLNKEDFEIKIKEFLAYSFKNNLIKNITENSVITKNIELNKEKWKYFNLEKLFDIKGSKSITTTDIQEYGKGKFPYVVTSSENNGTEGFYDYYTEKGNILTIDSATVGSCFYQPLDFSASDHVEKLIPKFNMNKYIAIFVATIINLEQIRYGYGRKFAQKRIEKTNIKLPADLDGNPDWQFMENYIKSLQYSSNI